ncbi:Hypothetical_protein [Hexamita inflata]|uniref:Hypothetical_protein n=1 Tax=Hexamita inflata TaxID=28002 RepID=A0AA86ND49_9EUKA|nr:Hypothetical protein HINF_LOCUS4613 [Hexamita inflata]CAI9965063.1 Hypothetical protein HINF_LOCUS52708 [Hexamita inflata]
MNNKNQLVNKKYSSSQTVLQNLKVQKQEFRPPADSVSHKKKLDWVRTQYLFGVYEIESLNSSVHPSANQIHLNTYKPFQKKNQQQLITQQINKQIENNMQMIPQVKQPQIQLSRPQTVEKYLPAIILNGKFQISKERPKSAQGFQLRNKYQEVLDSFKKVE